MQSVVCVFPQNPKFPSPQKNTQNTKKTLKNASNLFPRYVFSPPRTWGVELTQRTYTHAGNMLLWFPSFSNRLLASRNSIIGLRTGTGKHFRLHYIHRIVTGWHSIRGIFLGCKPRSSIDNWGRSSNRGREAPANRGQSPKKNGEWSGEGLTNKKIKLETIHFGAYLTEASFRGAGGRRLPPKEKEKKRKRKKKKEKKKEGNYEWRQIT